MLRSFLTICCRQFQRQDCSSQQSENFNEDSTEDVTGSFNKIVEDIDQAIEHFVNEQSYSDSTPAVLSNEKSIKSF